MLNIQISFYQISIEIIIEMIFLFILLLSSALISGSEVAFFSFTPTNLNSLKNSDSKTSKAILKLLKNPERLLATILITNNFVNIGIIILSTFITSALINFENIQWLKFVFEVIFVTFLILLFGEIIPKVYANLKNKTFAKLLVFPIFYLDKILYPISYLLLKSTSIVNKIFTNKQKMSIQDISDAIDIAAVGAKLEKEILKSAITFGKTQVREIMTPRIDVITIEVHEKFTKVKQIIMDTGFSRIPIFQDNFDNIKGVLYTKDLIKYLDKKADFKWNKLIRKPYFVPETKKIDNLLQEFREKKNHLALVSHEYGGISGIITLEDILEEIIGEIQDEFDTQDDNYKIIDQNNFIFEGKFPLKDFYKIVNAPENVFDKVKGDSDTLAGIILQIITDIPKKGDVIHYKNYSFTIESADNRKIKQIRVKNNEKK